ncbi:ribosomal L1 domain-containing protein 1-like [Phoenix dactylifera]|uniref:Ribosomal L1 domain-containing protein 1-like n=1 Tax=Phoenix dactylifera TaxID=42345 RepID=A0A8B7D0A7_PHODC|nr:ribosomal L1 domain-containing protein 1-like [Phoenix dactylifera]
MAGAATTELSFSSSYRMISREAVGKAVDALLKWMRSRTEQQQKAQLLDPDDDLLYLVLTLKRIPPKSRINPYRIPLPHPLHDLASTSACLFLDDRDRSGRRRSSSCLTTAAAALDRARCLSLPLSDAIPLSALAADYRPFEARRRLCDSHDLFFADRAVLPLLPRLLGKHFFKNKKLPLALDLYRPGWPEQLRACLHATLLHLRAGSCSVLKVGRLSMSRDQIVDNVMAATEGAMAHVPKTWANVRSLHVKAVNSVALPIYQAVPELGLKIEVPVPRVPQKKDEMEKDAAEDPIGEGEVVQEEEKPKMKEEMPKKGRRIHEVPYMDTSDDLDLGYEEFLNGESEDEGILEEEGGEARMEETMNKDKTEKNKTKEGVQVGDGKQKKKKGKREDDNKNHREEEGNRKGKGESMVAVAKKKELKKDGEVKKEKDKKGRKGSSAVDSVTDGNYDAGKDGDVDILSGDDEVEKVGAMKKLKKDDKMKKEKAKSSKNDGREDDDRGHKDGGAEESYNGMTTSKKVMKVTKENAKVKKGKDGMTNRWEDKVVKKIKRTKLRHETD